MVTQIGLKLDVSLLGHYSTISEQLVLHLMNEIGLFYTRTRNIRIARLMIRIFKYEKLSKDARMFAYVSFLEVIGRLIEENPNLGSFRITDDVNWNLVNRCTTFVGNIGIVCHRVWRFFTFRESEW
jgi:hypothetical protein